MSCDGRRSIHRYVLDIDSARIKGESLELAVCHRRVERHEHAAQGVMSIDPEAERGSESIGIKIGGHLEGAAEPRGRGCGAAVECLKRAQQADTRWALQHGKCVVEVRPAAVDKGKALQVLMQAPCFAGRRPLFIGDDLSDEAGFAAAQALGGKGIRVGDGHTRADYRLANPDAVEAWLKRLMTPQGVRACANEWEDAS